MSGKLNLILIQVDQWPAFALSLLGNPNVRTPYLDRLVDSGNAALFEQCVCQNPVCLPSRVSMLSGQYPSTTRQFGFTGLNARDLPWLPRYLQGQGIATGAFGKFHVASVGIGEFGFDAAAPTLPEDEDFAAPAGNHYRHYCEAHGIGWPTDQMHGHDWRGRNATPSAAAGPLRDQHRLVQTSCMSDVPLAHSLERWTVDRALDFIREQAANECPFFTWLTFDRPHHPQTVPAEWWDRRRPEDLVLERLLNDEELALHGPAMRNMLTNNFRTLLGEDGFRYLLASYFALIEGIDEEIGRVVTELERLGIDEQTSIVFTADHGDEAGHHGLYMKFRDVCSTAITQVPLIVRPARLLCPKGVTRPRRVEPVELVDLAPTICALLGCLALPGSEGRDLSHAILNDDALDPDRPVFCEDINGRMILHQGWMLAFYGHDDGHSQLYDLNRDPGQYRNLYGDIAAGERRIDLKRRLIGFLSQRQYGAYTDDDVAVMRRSLDPDDPMVPLHTWFQQNEGHVIDQCRCALFYHGQGEKVFVPFYDGEEILYFRDSSEHLAHLHFIYATRDTAVHCGQARLEAALDEVLRRLIAQSHTVSTLK